MYENFYLEDRQAVFDAADLIAEFGAHAGMEAAARASRSREKGNVVHFCRWRQIERLVDWMDSAENEATRH
ncbi:hypothetical protein [Parasphingopyxis sp.]|uniref:hypothetical protein n=1 Tax=Parasphingopyxis sp. TaxID=1920299 RepID=UPI002622378C|nr:hypothetical protein [Parasphingopyxis sp.]